MTQQELLQLKRRRDDKITEILNKMKLLEEGYINDTTTLRVGQPYLLSSTKVKNKVVETFGFVKELNVDYQHSKHPVIRVSIYRKYKDLSGQEQERYVKTLYI